MTQCSALLTFVHDVTYLVRCNADTPDFEGRGESVPVPYFFQNLAEAEYVVTLYQYMRLLGYPAEKISMLTTYNGQKALLKDVVERRCAHHPAFGSPHKVGLQTTDMTAAQGYICGIEARTAVKSSCATLQAPAGCQKAVDM